MAEAQHFKPYDRIIILLAGAFGALTLAALWLERPYGAVSAADAALWLACLGMFILADLMAGDSDDCLWASYLSFNGLVVWLVMGIGPALALLVMGAALAGFIRLNPPQRLGLRPLTRARSGMLSMLRLVVCGAVLLAAAVVYAALDGSLPYNETSSGAALKVIAALGAAFLVFQGIKAQRARGQGTPQIFGVRYLLNELLPILLVPSLALVYHQAGIIVFLALLALLAAHVVRSRQVSHTRQTLSRRIQELSILNTIGESISTNLATDEVLLGIYRQVRQLLDVSVFYIALYDSETQQIQFRLAIDGDQPASWPSHSLGRQSVTDHVIQTKTMLHAGRDEIRRLNLEIPGSPAFRAYLGLPLMAGTKVLGVMGVVQSDTAQPLDNTAVEILQLIANQAGMAIRNASLYDRSVKLAQNLTLINQSVQDVMFNLDNEDAMQVACQTAMQISGAARAAIFLVNPENKGQLNLAQAANLTEAHSALYQQAAFLPDFPQTESRAVDDVNALPPGDRLRLLADAGRFRAMAQIPLRSSTLSIGVLIVFHNEPQVYDATLLKLLETLAHQVTAALDNADLLKDLELYASEQAQLVHLSRISTSSLKLETIIGRVSQMVQQMMGVGRVNIALMHQDRDLLRVYNGAANTPPQDLVVSEVPEVRLMTDQPQPVPRVFYREDEAVSPQLQGLMQQQRDETLALMPMQANNTLLGVIMLAHPEARYFTDSEWRLMEMASNQVATQLHNAQLHDMTENALNRRLQQLALIESIAQQITSALDLEQLIHNVLEAAIRATQCDMAALGLVTDNDAVRIIVHKQSEAGEWLKYEAIQAAHEGLIGQAIQSRKTLIVPDNRQASGYIVESTYRPLLSSLVIPLIVEDKPIGALNIESCTPDFFQDEQVEFAKNLAGHALISIQNARLLQERQAQIEMLTGLRDLSVRLSSDTNLISVTKAIAQTAITLIQGHSALLMQYNPETEELETLSSTRREGSSFLSALTHVPEEIIRQTARYSQTQVIEDVFQHELYQTYSQLSDVDYQGLICTPIKRGQQVTEVLSVMLPRHHHITSGDVSTIELLAIQSAGHLENTALYERIRTYSNRMRAILDSTRDGIILLDRTGQLIEANMSAEQLLGIDLEDYQGQHFAMMLMKAMQVGGVVDDGVQEALTDMARVLRLEPRRITNQSLEIRRGSTVRYIEAVGSPIDSTNSFTGRLLTLRDVTEERLLAAYRDEISNMVVHDLRGPLSSIISSLNLAVEMIREHSDDLLKDVVAPTLEVSMDSASTLLSLVDSLLDIARLETRRMPLRPAIVSVDDMVRSAFLALSNSINEAQVQVEILIPDDLPTVEVDADKIRRVLINLLDNAVRYTPQGGKIQISAARMGNKKVIMRVADSGGGIPPEESERVFEKFSQIKGSTPSHGRKGSGLGLTFCKLAIEAHGEKIWVEQYGPLSGACFAFTLPVTLDFPVLVERDSIDEAGGAE